MSYKVVIVSLLMLIFHLGLSLGYKPVVIIHGVLDKAGGLDQFAGFIEKYHPGTNVTIVDIYDGWRSLTPLWAQVKKFSLSVSEISQSSDNGIHLIGYSQGGLISRGILCSLSDHNVDTFISLSAPQMGQYGDTSYLKWLFPNNVKTNLYKVLYTNYGQRISIGNYWNDPFHQLLYRNFSNYLAVLNNDTLKPTPLSAFYKNNFLKINKLVLIGGPDDGVITPWQSSQFGFYDSNENIVDMLDQKVFKHNTFGLQTLFHQRKIIINTVPGVEHLNWHKNETVFTEYILPWLT